MQKKPQSHTLKAQHKLHKSGNPIRPVVNNMSAPSYKISKHINNTLNAYLCFNNCYNIKNSISLAEDLTKFKINENYKMKNMISVLVRRRWSVLGLSPGA